MGVQWKRYLRWSRWVNSLRFTLTDSFIKRAEPTPNEPKRLLIVKTEAIGDYILFRNFLKYIRNNEVYKNYHITLVGNEIWQSLSAKLDAPFYDEGIFLNRKRFQVDLKYRTEKLTEIASKAYDVAINATYSREFLLGDSIIKKVTANQKIGMLGDSASEIPTVHFFTEGVYTNLIANAPNEHFEFNRNKHFFESILERRMLLKAPLIEIIPNRKPIAYLFVGAQDASRRWPIERFKEIANFLHAQFNFNVLLAGSEDDFNEAEKMLDQTNQSYLKNVCGKSTLADLPQMLSEASLAICNDSGTLHLSAALNTPSICISNGNHYGRFTPYPNMGLRPLAFLYPASFLNQNKSEINRRMSMANGSNFSINEITVAQVQQAIERVLHE
jgi:ADP-heptose:LPS heptosyltransferase